MPTRPVRFAAAGVAAVLGAVVPTACGEDTPTTASAGSQSAAAPTESVTVTVSGGGVEAPESIPGGLVELTVANDTDTEAGVQFVEIGEASLEELATALPEALEGGPIPDFVGGAAGTSAAPAGRSVTDAVAIQEGRYAVFDPYGEGGVGGATVVEVTEAAGQSELPDTEASIITRDHEFEIDIPEGGEQSVSMTNEGPDELHHAVFRLFPAGTSEEEARAAWEASLSGDGEVPDGLPVPTDELETAVFGGENSGTFTMPVEEGGTYVVACTIGDRSGGPPHAVAYDMWEVFTVGG